MNPQFEPVEDGVEIIDPIERHRYRLTTHESVSLEPVGCDRIQYPVSTAVELTTEMITLPTNELVYVRDGDGEMVAEVRPGKPASLPRETYTLDLSGPLKVYANATSSVSIYADNDRTYITFDESTRVTLGARSYHRRPAGTITTTAEPTDVMEAVSAFGSALKSTTSERSFPTHRGHPPALELGDRLEIPDDFRRPETGVRIDVPPTLGDVFVVTPLAYYLGAEVEAGSTPRLVTANGFTYGLEGPNGFEKTIERVLKQIFFLDCVVRTEGGTPLPLAERAAVEPELDFDVEAVYDRPLAEQLEAYLTVPFETIEPHLFEWRLEVAVSPSPETIEFLPYLTDELATITVQETVDRPTADGRATTEAIEEFTRGARHRDSSVARGADSDSPTEDEVTVDRITQQWRSTRSSDIASETPLSAYRNSIGREPNEGPIEITIVCNDSAMEAELETANDVYGFRDEVPFDVTVQYDAGTAELRELLLADVDFVHFIGHIDENGFQCPDGHLDAASLDAVGPKAFFLNACQSRKQGLELVRAGSIGGIVTIDDVINSGAITVGGVIARLLNSGFPLYAALDVARRETVVGNQYFLVGNGMTTIAQSETGPPLTCSVARDGEAFAVELETYLKRNAVRKGGLYTPYFDGNDQYFLVSGLLDGFTLSQEQLQEFLEMEQLPVITGNSVIWSPEVTLEEV